MTINFATLEIELSKKIKTTSDPYDLLLYSKVLENLKQNLVTTVSTYNNLPVISTVNLGDMVYVEDEKLMYFADKTANRNVWRRAFDDYVSIMMAWGTNVLGNLGINSSTITSAVSPTSIPTNRLDKWDSVSSGACHVLARNSGVLWAWGSNGYGRLGDNTSSNKSSPVSVVGGFTDWSTFTAGSSHSTAIRTNGTLWAWGRNNSGQLGDLTITSMSSPVSVVGGFTDWYQVSAGSYTTTALRSNGTVWAWGQNNSGQIGDGTVVAKSSPVSVVGGFTDWCQVSSSGSHTIALRTNGTAWAWGCNGQGRLGDNTILNKSSPVSVVGGFTDWCQASAGAQHSAAIRTNGTLWVWGYSAQGRLGDNTTVDKSSPVSVVGGFTDWCQVSMNRFSTVALRTNGTAWAWGSNSGGRLGDGTTTSRSSPVSVVGGVSDWVQISSGDVTVGIRKIML